MQKSHQWKYRSLFIVVLVALIHMPVWAQRPEAGKRRVIVPGGGPVNRLIVQLRRLDLSEEQTQAIRQLVRKAQPRGEEVQEAVRAARQKLAKKTLRGADQEALAEAVDKLSEALLEQAVFQARVCNAIRSELTQEQKAQLKEQQAPPKERESRPRQPQRQRRGRMQDKDPLDF